MSRGSKSHRHSKPSIKYGCGQLDGASFDLADFDLKDYVSTSENNKKKGGSPEVRSSEILSTTELISAIGSAWNHATRPLSVLLPKSSCRCDNSSVRKQSILGYSTEKRRYSECAADDEQTYLVNFTINGDSRSLGHANLEYLKLIDKLSFTEPSAATYSLLRRLTLGNPRSPYACLKEKDVSNLGIPFDTEKVYGWMREIAFANPEHQMNFDAIKKLKNDYQHGQNISGLASFHASVDKASDADCLVSQNANCCTDKTKLAVASSGQNESHATDMRVTASSYLCKHATVEGIEACTSQVQSSKLSAGSHVSVTPSGSDFEGSKTLAEHDLQKVKNEQRDFISEDNSELGTFLTMKEKPHNMLARQEHAFAGAMAGIFVSLCLHPVDTIKTVVQSCRANPKSLHDISRSIISERGVTGLYRGISTNIASTAPISAVYTFTYESVKGTLLPFFPKEYESFAHCTAGGCASIATSFIFTPSERIKQQMQIGSRYQNCWNALLGIIGKGGLPSLYTGWGAVLCRNIPHSVIKFYTYESLKKLLSSVQLGGQTNTCATLVAGGLAGSTAALFTTPFDVVKTRLQTQNPGSINQYHGVLDTLKEIAKSEGLKGLYRGLTPRLFMYMMQGALFFASYESLKSLLSLKVPGIKKVQAAVGNEEKREDHSSDGFVDQDEDSSLIYMFVS
ncbi:hypothetical protein M9H77_32664 [Catharanthus roseus]|uniref:Uncharacterized protein n=1 Tax=Catharanthus roseus TaxID=4058 RepID=A0ACC0A4U0_CATRO|nr:hypothetical protein M9H77_32664 [Catharanthus roseus]